MALSILVSFHKFSRQLSVFSLSSSGLISALLVLSTICLFVKDLISPDRIPSGWLGSRHHLTNYKSVVFTQALECMWYTCCLAVFIMISVAFTVLWLCFIVWKQQNNNKQNTEDPMHCLTELITADDRFSFMYTCPSWLPPLQRITNGKCTQFAVCLHILHSYLLPSHDGKIPPDRVHKVGINKESKVTIHGLWKPSESFRVTIHRLWSPLITAVVLWWQFLDDEV